MIWCVFSEDNNCRPERKESSLEAWRQEMNYWIWIRMTVTKMERSRWIEDLLGRFGSTGLNDKSDVGDQGTYILHPVWPPGSWPSSKAITGARVWDAASGGKQAVRKEGRTQLKETAGHPSVAVQQAASRPTRAGDQSERNGRNHIECTVSTGPGVY